MRAERRLSLNSMAGIVEYTPGDLTLTARAGTTLGQLDRVTAAEGQWLPLDPFYGIAAGEPADAGAFDGAWPAAGSIGATAATASAGPLAHAFGSPRDIVLGVEFVTGSGDVVRAGGRVVKNVAGFDLTRLTIGAWGTLGVITELSLRLRARPEVDETVVAFLPADPGELVTTVEALRVAPLAAMALELVNAPLARKLDIASSTDRTASSTVVVARLGGNADAVSAQRGAISAIRSSAMTRKGGHSGLEVHEIADAVTFWRNLRSCEPARAAVLRLSAPPARIGVTWLAALQLEQALPNTLLHATVGRGVVRCIMPVTDAGALQRAIAAVPAPVTRIFERLPADAWPLLAPAAARDRLSRRVRDAFDPERLLNPGILGEADA